MRTNVQLESEKLEHHESFLLGFSLALSLHLLPYALLLRLCALRAASSLSLVLLVLCLRLAYGVDLRLLESFLLTWPTAF